MINGLIIQEIFKMILIKASVIGLLVLTCKKPFLMILYTLFLLMMLLGLIAVI